MAEQERRDPIITIDSVSKSFAGGIEAVRGFSATVERQEVVVIMGPSGSGKSTLLRCLNGLEHVDSGSITVDGIPLDDDRHHRLEIRKEVGMVFQSFNLFPHLTALANINLAQERVRRKSREEATARSMELLRTVGIAEKALAYPAQLSGGQQQRVAIARALVKNPKLLLLDEPLSNLDARLRLEMREEIRRIQQQTQVTTVFVTHDQEEAMSISDHIALMKDGYLQQYDKPQQLYDSPNNQFVADFLGAPPINHLNGTLVNGQFTLTDGSAAFPLPLPVDGVPQGKPLILAIRAESAAVAESAEQAAFPATVKQVYTMGKEELAYLSVGTQEMRAYIDLDAGIVPGAPLHVALKPRGVFLFDAETGVRYQ